MLSWLNIEERRRKQGNFFFALCVTKIVTYLKKFELTQYRRKKKKKQGKFLCPMCYKNCHIPEKILSWLNIEERKKKKKQGKFFSPMCYKICHIPEKILSWLNIKERKKKKKQ